MSAARVRALIAAAALTVAACASPREHFYTLLDPAVTLQEPPANPALVVIIDPVKVPADVDRLELVVRDTEHRVLVLEQERWIEPLAAGFRRALARDLAARLPQAAVHEDEPGAARNAVRVAVSVRRLDAAFDAGVSLEAEWVVTSTEALRREGLTVTHSPLRAHGYPEMVAADAATIDRLSEAIAAAVTSIWLEARQE